MVGLDTFYQVIHNMQGKMNDTEEIEMYQIPVLLEEMLKKKCWAERYKRDFIEKRKRGYKF